MDRWTMLRIRIAKILNKQPTLTAKEVLATLKPDSPIRLCWVWQVMSEYFWASHRPSRRARREGRRFHPLWRPA